MLLLMKDKKIAPAHIHLSASPSYTVDEIKTLAREFLETLPLNRDLQHDLILSQFALWLARREKEGDDG